MNSWRLSEHIGPDVPGQAEHDFAQTAFLFHSLRSRLCNAPILQSLGDAGDKIAGATVSPQTMKADRLRHNIRKVGGPTASLVSQSGLRQHHTGAPAAYCFDIHTRRASRTTRLSAPEHHRYVRVLDWKVAHEATKTNRIAEKAPEAFDSALNINFDDLSPAVDPYHRSRLGYLGEQLLLQMNHPDQIRDGRFGFAVLQPLHGSVDELFD